MIPPGFAADWESAWNSHDLELILAHYHPGIVFRSAKAVATVGTGVIRGLPALRIYWEAALARQPDLRFKVEEVFEGHDTLTLIYSNQVARRAAENLLFDEDGRVVEASASHGDGAFT